MSPEGVDNITTHSSKRKSASSQSDLVSQNIYITQDTSVVWIQFVV